MFIIRAGFISLFLVLSSCASNESEPIVYSGGTDDVKEAVLPDTTPVQSEPFVRQRILADMLYEARVAFEDNRLTSPAGKNALDGFRSVLDFEPDNEVALQGIRDIVMRYVELADAAIQIGQYDSAESLLDRGARLGVNNAIIADARKRLAQVQDTEMTVFPLDAEALSSQSLEVMVELGDIGHYIRNREATFLINARSDEEGRWIYKIMREAVGGFRLRGNIGVASEPSIQVVIPGA